MANNNGLRLLRTCVDHDLVVTNTFFKHPDAHTATWLNIDAKVYVMLLLRRLRVDMEDRLHDAQWLP